MYLIINAPRGQKETYNTGTLLPLSQEQQQPGRYSEKPRSLTNSAALRLRLYRSYHLVTPSMSRNSCCSETFIQNNTVGEVSRIQQCEASAPRAVVRLTHCSSLKSHLVLNLNFVLNFVLNLLSVLVVFFFWWGRLSQVRALCFSFLRRGTRLLLCVSEDQRCRVRNIDAVQFHRMFIYNNISSGPFHLVHIQTATLRHLSHYLIYSLIFTVPSRVRLMSDTFS